MWWLCPQPLLTNEKMQQDALLPVSALVNNYCDGSPSCAEDPEVQKVLDTLTGFLGDACHVDNKNFKQVSRHALGKAYNAVKRAVSLINCRGSRVL